MIPELRARLLAADHVEAEGITSGDGALDEIVEVLVQPANEGFLHRRMGLAYLGAGERVGTGSGLDGDSILIKLRHFAFDENIVEHPDDEVSYVGDLHLPFSIPHAPGDRLAIVPAHISDKLQPLVAELLDDGLVQNTYAGRQPPDNLAIAHLQRDFLSLHRRRIPNHAIPPSSISCATASRVGPDGAAERLYRRVRVVGKPDVRLDTHLGSHRQGYHTE